MEQLPSQIHKKIEALCAEGDDLIENNRFDQALEKYRAAWDFLPEPKIHWKASMWILASIGDANFIKRDYQAGFDSFKHAMYCPDAIGNPFLHLRLGQCLYELQDFKRAADELTRAYAIQGEEIFKNEDRKYFDFLKPKLKETVSEL